MRYPASEKLEIIRIVERSHLPAKRTLDKPSFSDEFKRDAVAQITERRYRVAEVSQRLGVCQLSLFAWKRQLAKVVSGDASKDADPR